MQTPTVQPIAHRVEGSVETYEFESRVNPSQTNSVNRTDDGPWTIGPVDLPNSGEITVEQAVALTTELRVLVEFARLQESAS